MTKIKERLAGLSDRELLKRLIHAEKMERRARKRYRQLCREHGIKNPYVECVDDFFVAHHPLPLSTSTPGPVQEAESENAFWTGMCKKLYAEEDRRGGFEALFQRLEGAT